MYTLIKDGNNSGLFVPVWVTFNTNQLHGAKIEVVVVSELPAHLQIQRAEANRDILLGMAREYDVQISELEE